MWKEVCCRPLFRTLVVCIVAVAVVAGGVATPAVADGGGAVADDAATDRHDASDSEHGSGADDDAVTHVLVVTEEGSRLVGVEEFREYAAGGGSSVGSDTAGAYGVTVGDEPVATDGVSTGQSVHEESVSVESDVDAAPDDGTLSYVVVTESDDRGVYAFGDCDLSSGPITACEVINVLPVTASDAAAEAPEDVQEQLDGEVVGLVDLAVQDPQTGLLLVISTVSGELPEESPVSSPLNPGYPVNDPPVDLANPDESLDPTVERRNASSTGTGGTVSASEEVYAGGVAGVDPDGGVSTGLDASDGHNVHGIDATAAASGVQSGTDGPVDSTAVLNDTDQHASVLVDLGGQPYVASLDPDLAEGDLDPTVGPYEGETRSNERAEPTETPADGSGQDDPTDDADEESEQGPTPTETSDESAQTPTETPDEQTPTPTGTSDEQTPTPTETPDDGGERAESTTTGQGDDRRTQAADDAATDQPGFGVVAAVLALLGTGLLVRRRR